MLVSLFRSFFRAARKSRTAYQPLIDVRIFKNQLRANYRAYEQAAAPLRVAPVLKSNAYGHGLVEVARILDDIGAPFFMVDSFHEALILRNEGICTPLLIVGYTPTATITHSHLHAVAFTISSLNQLEELSSFTSKKISVHLKIDTGMHRQGVLPYELDRALKLIMSSRVFHLEGIASHLADPDTPQSALTTRQIETWNACAKHIETSIGSLPHRHCLATAGLAYRDQINSNILRLGIGLYGIPFGFNQPHVLPTLELRTIITAIKNIEIGESVGYNGIFCAPSSMTIATIPCGYAEGLDRRLSNQSAVRVRGKNCPIVGRISMNIATIDVSSVPDIKTGDEVVVFSSDASHTNSIVNSAKFCITVPHELLVHIQPSLRRKIIE